MRAPEFPIKTAHVQNHENELKTLTHAVKITHVLFIKGESFGYPLETMLVQRQTFLFLKILNF